MITDFYARHRRFLILLCLIVATEIPASAQPGELVPNGDFENFVRCPASIGGMQYSNVYGTWSSVTDWASPLLGSSPDYMNSCATSALTGVPLNFVGYRTARSGGGYVGIFTCANYRSEYIMTRLVRPMVKDSIYNVRFYTSPAGCGVIEGATSTATIVGVREIGASFSDTLVHFLRASDTAIPHAYHVVSPKDKKMTDTSKWYEVSGQYTAKGGERWMTIGRFVHPAEPVLYDTIRHSGRSSPYPYVFAYNYIEDVSVVRVAKKGVPTSVGSTSLQELVLSPNPANSRIRIEGLASIKSTLNVTISSINGQRVKQFQVIAPAEDHDISELGPGIYFVRMDIAGETIVRRLVKN